MNVVISVVLGSVSNCAVLKLERVDLFTEGKLEMFGTNCPSTVNASVLCEFKNGKQ